jgi:hypothetical protein
MKRKAFNRHAEISDRGGRKPFISMPQHHNLINEVIVEVAI